MGLAGTFRLSEAALVAARLLICSEERPLCAQSALGWKSTGGAPGGGNERGDELGGFPDGVSALLSGGREPCPQRSTPPKASWPSGQLHGLAQSGKGNTGPEL